MDMVDEAIAKSEKILIIPKGKTFSIADEIVNYSKYDIIITHRDGIGTIVKSRYCSTFALLTERQFAIASLKGEHVNA